MNTSTGHPNKTQPSRPTGQENRPYISMGATMRLINGQIHCVPTSPPITKGQLRDHPCLRCIRSALAGKSTGSCHNAIGRNDRCCECCVDTRGNSQGVSCIPIEETDMHFERLVAGWNDFKSESSQGISTSGSDYGIESPPSPSIPEHSVGSTRKASKKSPDHLAAEHIADGDSSAKSVFPMTYTLKHAPNMEISRQPIYYNSPEPAVTGQETASLHESEGESSSTMGHEEQPPYGPRKLRGDRIANARTSPSFVVSEHWPTPSPPLFYNQYPSHTVFPISQVAKQSEGTRRHQENIRERGSTPATTKNIQEPAEPAEKTEERLSSLFDEGYPGSRPVFHGLESPQPFDRQEGERIRKRNVQVNGVGTYSIMDSIFNEVNKTCNPRKSNNEPLVEKGRQQATAYKRTRSRSPSPEPRPRKRFRAPSPYPSTRSDSETESDESGIDKLFEHPQRTDEEVMRRLDELDELDEQRASEERARRLDEQRGVREEMMNSMDRQTSKEGEQEVEMDVDPVAPAFAARRTRIKKVLHDLTDLVVDFFVN